MIGAWSLNAGFFLFTFVRLTIVFLLLYFLAIVIYWFNRTGKVPSLRVIGRSMIQLAKWFPKILIHRVKIIPSRIRRKKVDAYPALNGYHSAKNKKVKLRKKKR